MTQRQGSRREYDTHYNGFKRQIDLLHVGQLCGLLYSHGQCFLESCRTDPRSVRRYSWTEKDLYNLVAAELADRIGLDEFEKMITGSAPIESPYPSTIMLAPEGTCFDIPDITEVIIEEAEKIATTKREGTETTVEEAKKIVTLDGAVIRAEPKIGVSLHYCFVMDSKYPVKEAIAREGKLDTEDGIYQGIVIHPHQPAELQECLMVMGKKFGLIRKQSLWVYPNSMVDAYVEHLRTNAGRILSKGVYEEHQETLRKRKLAPLYLILYDRNNGRFQNIGTIINGKSKSFNYIGSGFRRFVSRKMPNESWARYQYALAQLRTLTRFLRMPTKRSRRIKVQGKDPGRQTLLA